MGTWNQEDRPMRRLLLLLATTCVLVTQGAAEPADPGPWTVSDISKSDSHRHAKLETGDTPGPLKYLHLGVRFAPNASDRQLLKFQVVDTKGKPVGDLFGADPKTSQLVFERETPWSSLDGLYLQGQGIRVPLFATQPVQPVPTTPVQPTPVPSPVIVDRPRTDYVPPSPEVLLPFRPIDPNRTVIVEEPRERVVVRSVDQDVDLLPSPDMAYEEVVRHVDTHREVVHHTGGGGGVGVGGGGGHGHGHGGGGGGGGGMGAGGGGGGCPYGDDCPICGKNAKESLDALDPWAFDESAKGRYDDLLARIENSGAALNLGSAGAGGGSGTGTGVGRGGGSGGLGVGGAGPAGAAGPGAGIGAGSGSGLGVGQSGGPLPGMASTGSGTGSGLGRGPGLPGMGGPGAGPGSG